MVNKTNKGSEPAKSNRFLRSLYCRTKYRNDGNLIFAIPKQHIQCCIRYWLEISYSYARKQFRDAHQP